MIFPEINIFSPSSFEDYRGELYTLYDYKELPLQYI